MKGIASVLSSPLNLMIKLLEIVKKYQKKKKTESLFLNAFENEIETYLDTYGQAFDLSEKQIIPILESIGDELTPHEMNELLEKMAPIPLIHAEMINAFISFARACSEVSALRGFMENLKETNIVLYDFVDMMKNTYVGKNKVVIDGRYYRFFQTYKKDIFGEVEEIDTNELKPYLKKLEKYVDKVRQYTKTALIKRRILKKYKRNYHKLVKTAAGMTIEKTTIIDLTSYVPQTLLPVAIFLEELLL